MALKRVLKKEEWEALGSDEVKALYVEKEGKYHLDAEQDIDPALQKKVEEFRNKNIDLMKKIEDMSNKMADLEGIDPDEYKKLKDEIEKLRDNKMIEEGKIEELLQSRTERLRKDYDGQIKALTESRDKLASELSTQKAKLVEALIDNKIQIAVSKYTKPKDGGCIDDIVARGRRYFVMGENDKPVARDPLTGDAMFGKDATPPLTIDEWVQDLPTSAPWFFEPSHGGGAGGGAGGDDEGKRKLPDNFHEMDAAEKFKYAHKMGDIGKGVGKK